MRARDEEDALAIEIGLSNEKRYRVTDEMAPPHLPVKVLGTPDMIGLIEGTCLFATQPFLEKGQATVGTHICVSHQGAALLHQPLQSAHGSAFGL